MTVNYQNSYVSKYQLDLQAVPGAWRLYSARKADIKFKTYTAKILQRDNYTCQFCGFKAKLFQDVVNLDNNYKNNKSANLVTSCCFCAQCFFLESVGVGGYGGGTLILLPELSQADVNSLCHVLFCAITNDTGYKISAQEIYRSLKSRSQLIEGKYGEGTSDPAIFGQLVIDSESTDSVLMNKIFVDIRLLPSRAQFRKQIENWASDALIDMIGMNKIITK